SALPQRGLQALLLALLLLGGGSPGAARGHRFCRPVNATIAAEKDDCPVCVTFPAAICSGYCQTKEPVYKSVLTPVSQHVCTYRAVRYETLALPGCPPGVDPAFTFPVALSCHCSLCPMDSSDCTVQSIGPDFCSARGGFASGGPQ
uniref:Glycoprotein hormone subunit beta domain-containing protein n=1 Tax=Pelusios castaneus TaxID=367368 RepID=A0A8C8RHQ8_9SAUR